MSMEEVAQPASISAALRTICPLGRMSCTPFASTGLEQQALERAEAPCHFQGRGLIFMLMQQQRWFELRNLLSRAATREHPVIRRADGDGLVCDQVEIA